MSDLSQFYIKWRALKEDAKLDCKAIDKGALEGEFNLTELNMKWLAIQMDWKAAYIQLEHKMKKEKRRLIEFYKMDYNMKFDTKEELMLFIESDDSYVGILEKSQIILAIIEFCGNVIKKLEGKSWEIKNYLDYIRWTKGLLE